MFKYKGSFKERLDDEPVRKDVKKIMTKITIEYMTKNKEKAMKFLWRFDENELMSKIM